MTGLVLVGIGGVLAVGAAAAYVLSRSSSAEQPRESADSVLEGTPPRRTDEQNGNATAGAVRDAIGLARDGLGLLRERLDAGDNERATQRKQQIAGERSAGTET